MQYEVTAINNGVVTVSYEDGSWAEVPLYEGMTEAEVDAAILAFGPKALGTPAFLSVGYTRSINPPADPVMPDLATPDTTMAWFQARTEAYGPVEAQIEYITENGLEAWQAYVAQVKANNPKE